MSSIILLSIIQGITEFLPISSSFHLIIFRDVFLLGKEILSSDIELTFDIALHLGTLFAILFYYYKDFKEMIIKKSNVLYLVLISTIPASIVGILFNDFIESFVRTKYLLIIIIFILMGIIIFLVDIKSVQSKSINKISLKDSLLIGISQIFALLPGVSRSGMTITTARLLKINREDATKYSFFLSVPIILGAAILQLYKIDYYIIINYSNYFFIGIITSFIFGLLCIKMLLKYVKNNNFKIFMIYRIVLGIIIFIYFLK